MKFKCKHCGWEHESEMGMHWQRKDDEAIHQHEKECPVKPRKQYECKYD